MKPKVDDKRCFASQNVCKAIKACPVQAISYIEVNTPILDKNLVCNCAPPQEIPPHAAVIAAGIAATICIAAAEHPMAGSSLIMTNALHAGFAHKNAAGRRSI